jgi:hypothetical protein
MGFSSRVRQHRNASLLNVGDLEPGVSDASSSGEPARFRYQDPGEIGAQSAPAAAGACREDGRVTASTPNVENVLSVPDLRGEPAASQTAKLTAISAVRLSPL